MEQHAVPRNISSFQFHLIGDMTLRQFGYLAAGGIVAFIIYKASPLPGILTMGIAGIAGFLGFAFAFVPIQERPLDRWLGAFIKSILSPTQYVWHKVPTLPDILTRPAVAHIQKVPQTQMEAHVEARDKLHAYLQSLPATPHQSLNLREKKYVDNTMNLFSKTPSFQPAVTSQPLPPVTRAIPEPAPVSPPPAPVTTHTIQTSVTTNPQVPTTLPPIIQPHASTSTPAIPVVATTPLSHGPISAAPVIPPAPAVHPITPVAVIHPPAAPLPPQQSAVPLTTTPTPHPITPITPAAIIAPASPTVSAPAPQGGAVVHQVTPTPTPTPTIIPRPAETANTVTQVPPGTTTAPPAPTEPQPPAPVVQTAPAPPPAHIQELEEMKKQLAELMEEKKRMAQELTSLKQAPPPSATTSAPQVVKPVVAKEEVKKPTIKAVTPRAAVDEIGLPSMPQTPNVVIGVIKDAQKKQLPNIILTIKDSKGMPIRALKTNKLGQFLTATPLANGTYYLEVEDPLKRYVFDVAEIVMKGDIFLPIEITAKGEKDLIREKLSKELFGNR